MHARVEEIFSTLGLVREQIGTSGQIALYSNPPEALRAWSRFLNEALARDHQSPQILRTARCFQEPCLPKILATSSPSFRKQPASSLGAFSERRRARSILGRAFGTCGSLG
jgi:hypothetical protein